MVPAAQPPVPYQSDSDSDKESVDFNVDPINLALQWIGFTAAVTRDRIHMEGFGRLFEDLKSIKEKDIPDLADSYGCRTVNDGQFIFGIHRVKYLIGMIHWVQDFTRICCI